MNKKLLLIGAIALTTVFDAMPAARGGKIAQIAAIKENLFDAIQEENISGLKRCLKNDFIKKHLNTLTYQPTQKMYDKCVGLTPLHLAMLVGWIDGVETLLQEGALLDTGSSRTVEKVSGSTPLHLFASASNHATDAKFDRIKKIIQKQKPNINVRDKDQWTPIFYAAQEGNARAMKMFIDLGADVNALDGFHMTPLYVAVQGKPEIKKFGSPACVELLMNAGADPDIAQEGGMTPLHFAAQFGDLACVQKLLESPLINPNLVGSKYQYTPLHFAVHNRKYDVLRALVQHHNVDFSVSDRNGNTVLGLAHSFGDSEAIEIILNAMESRVPGMSSSEPSCSNESAAPAETSCAPAGSSHSEESFDDLPELVEQTNPLSEACHTNDFETMRALINSGFDVNTIVDDILGWTPLFYAVSAGNVEAVEFLLQNGARRDVVDALGETPSKLHERIKGSTDKDDVIGLLLSVYVPRKSKHKQNK